MKLQQQMPRIKGLALIILAAALLALLWRSDDRTGETESSAIRGPDEPDSFIENGTFRSFDEDGTLVTQLNSPRIEQFEDRKMARMSAPSAVLRTAPGDPPWRLKANQGEYDIKRETIRLSEEVVIRRSMAGGEETLLTTRSLTLDNSKRIVHTDAPIEIKGPRGTTRAVGLMGWIDKRVIELQSQVEGIYEP